MIALKHDMRMLLADRIKPDRVKPDLIAAARAAIQAGDTSQAFVRAVAVLERGDNTVAPESRGGWVFETWRRRYAAFARDTAYAEPWSIDKLLTNDFVGRRTAHKPCEPRCRYIGRCLAWRW